MKKITCFLIFSLALLFVLCPLAGCDNKGDSTDNTKKTTQADKPCSEQDIRTLMEKDLDCVYCFFVAGVMQPQENAQATAGGYYQTDDMFFQNYKEFEDFVNSVYTKEKAEQLLTAYPTAEKPLYKNLDGDIYVNTTAYTIKPYKVAWDDSYTVNITKSDKTSCEFELITKQYDDDGKESEYKTTGSAEYESSGWRLSDLVY